MSYLKKSRTCETFLNLTDNDSTTRNRKSILNHFEKYCEKNYDRSMDTVIEDLVLVSKGESNQIEDLLQEYISHGFKNNPPKSIRVHYSILTRYLKYRGVTLDRESLKTVLVFPRIAYEELVPMNREIIRQFVDYASPIEKAKILIQSSSGLRNQEVCGLTKKDIQTDTIRWTIHVNTKIAKFKKARITFISNEAKRFLNPILEKLNPDDRIFGKRIG